MSKFISTNTIFTPMSLVDVPGVSNGANVRWRAMMAMTGVLKRVKTMKMEKIWSVFPVIYIPGALHQFKRVVHA